MTGFTMPVTASDVHPYTQGKQQTSKINQVSPTKLSKKTAQLSANIQADGGIEMENKIALKFKKFTAGAAIVGALSGAS